MRVALFDFDHTLLQADSNQLWMEYLQSQGLLGEGDMPRHDRFMQDYRHGRLDFAALDTFRAAVDAAVPQERLRACREFFTREFLLPAVAPGARSLLDGLRREQVLTMVVSASREALVRPVSEALGFEHVLAADSPHASNVAVPCFGPGKVEHVQGALRRLGTCLEDLQASWFYSDSHNDLPLLERVSHAVAVDPDPVLDQIARARGWPVISLGGHT